MCQESTSEPQCRTQFEKKKVFFPQLFYFFPCQLEQQIKRGGNSFKKRMEGDLCQAKQGSSNYIFAGWKTFSQGVTGKANFIIL